MNANHQPLKLVGGTFDSNNNECRPLIISSSRLRNNENHDNRKRQKINNNALSNQQPRRLVLSNQPFALVLSNQPSRTTPRVSSAQLAHNNDNVLNNRRSTQHLQKPSSQKIYFSSSQNAANRNPLRIPSTKLRISSQIEQSKSPTSSFVQQQSICDQSYC